MTTPEEDRPGAGGRGGGEAAPSPEISTAEDAVPIEVVTDGPLDPAVRGAAEELVGTVTSRSSRPLVFARVKVHAVDVADPDDRVRAQGTIDLGRQVVRAEAGGPSADQALSAMGERLERRLRRLEGRLADGTRHARGSSEDDPGEWRSDDLPTRRPSFHPRPPEERNIVRRKAWGPADMSLEEALFDLDVLDHRFYLFTDRADGEDAIVYESGEGLMVRRAAGGEPPEGAEGLPVTVNPAPAPELDDGDATHHLDESGEAFVFYRESGGGRGRALYRRYDGHYGLIVPAG